MDLLLRIYNVSNLADGNRRGWTSDDHFDVIVRWHAPSGTKTTRLDGPVRRVDADV
jgi:hypothetical protein